jgi:lipopolysaccharide biosynthesis regulator YciM
MPPWILDNLLAIVAITLTLILSYHYLFERNEGMRLSQRYRNSIYETQGQIFLNATQYLIRGEKDLAIKEFLNAVELNRETLDTYFALGGLFRSNGEFDKAISIHRSLIARNNISEDVRHRGLKELAMDFYKGGILDKAIETYQDVLKINNEQPDVLLQLCRIYEDLEDWDEAYKYRLMLGKISQEDQFETVSHILVQKAQQFFEKGEFRKSLEDLDTALRFAPTVSAKILQLKLNMVLGKMEDAQVMLVELVRQHPQFVTFIFVTLGELKFLNEDKREIYSENLKKLKKYFLSLTHNDIHHNAATVLTKIRLLKEFSQFEKAYDILKFWMDSEIHKNQTQSSEAEALKVEYIKLLISMGNLDEAIKATGHFLDGYHQQLARHFCGECGHNSESIFWRCPQCHAWETIQFRWKV